MTASGKGARGLIKSRVEISTTFLLKTMVKPLVNESLEFSVYFYYQQGKKIKPPASRIHPQGGLCQICTYHDKDKLIQT